MSWRELDDDELQLAIEARMARVNGELVFPGEPRRLVEWRESPHVQRVLDAAFGAAPLGTV